MIKVITKVEDIPLGSTVTKATGAVEYVLQEKLTIYGEPRQEIRALAGTRFIVPKEGHKWATGINAVPTDLEMAWVVEEYELYEYLNEKLTREDK